MLLNCNLFPFCFIGVILDLKKQHLQVQFNLASKKLSQNEKKSKRKKRKCNVTSQNRKSVFSPQKLTYPPNAITAYYKYGHIRVCHLLMAKITRSTLLYSEKARWSSQRETLAIRMCERRNNVALSRTQCLKSIVTLVQGKAHAELFWQSK